MKIQYPDYNNCIANLACSILNYYGVQPPNSTLPAADELLQKQYKNVVVLLLDGMGVSSLEQHLAEDGFFRRNMKGNYSSTFPPTTVAATTAADSGLFPNQSAWLGWVGYFKEIDRNVIYYWNIDNDNGEKIEELNAAWTYVPYESIRDKIREAGTDTYYLAPFLEPHYAGYGEFCQEIKRLCDLDSRKYIYAYWDEPDHSMHEHGVEGEVICDLISDIEKRTEQLVSELSDTLLIITADHGRDYMLFAKEEVLKQHLLGYGQNHARLGEMLGDYLAVGITDVAITNVPEANR